MDELGRSGGRASTNQGETGMPYSIAERRRRIEAQLQDYERALAEIRSSAGQGANSRALQLQHARLIAQARSELASLDAAQAQN
ncbi:hypothetical protein [Methylobacterium nodulans]|nr:hypothetical protein [Methylobacterium nodulans]